MAVSTGRLSSIEIQKGAAPINIAPEEQSPTRCELQGVLAWLAIIEKLLGSTTRGTIEDGCDSNAALKVIRKWLNGKYVSQEMLRGSNAYLLWDIRAVTRRLPEWELNWIKVKAHRKMDAKSFHKVINNEMDNLANMLHTDQEWKARNIAQKFASDLSQMKIGNTIINGHACKSLQRAFTMGGLVGKL